MSTSKGQGSVPSRIPKRVVHGFSQLPKTRDEETVYEVVTLPEDDTSSCSSANSASNMTLTSRLGKNKTVTKGGNKNVETNPSNSKRDVKGENSKNNMVNTELTADERARFLATKERIVRLRQRAAQAKNLNPNDMKFNLPGERAKMSDNHLQNLNELFELTEKLILDCKEDEIPGDHIDGTKNKSE